MNLITKSCQNRKIKTSGLTLVELLVYTIIVGIFITFVLSTFSHFFHVRDKTNKLNILQNTTATVFNELTQEIHWSEEAEITDSELILKKVVNEVEEEVIFNVSADGKLQKNGAAVTPGKVKVVDFTLANRAPAGEEKVECIEIHLGLEYEGTDPKISTDNQLTISLRQKGFQFQ